jgi:uracil-DNA glycosylase
MWNVISGWNGTIKVTAAELAAGVQDVAALIRLLPRLRTIVLVGRRAGKAESLIGSLGGYTILRSVHPSPQVRATRRDMWHRIPDVWAEAWRATIEATP